MKKILSACAVAAAFVAAPAFAQGYVGLGFGSSTMSNVDVAPVTGGNTSKGTVKVYGGFQITPNWGIEGQYSDLGKRDLRNTTTGATGDFRASQFSIAGTGTLPLSSGFSLLGKLGVSGNKLSGSANVGNGSATSLLIGVGVGYNFTPALSARLEYEDFGKMGTNAANNANVRANAYSLSLKYAF